MKIVIDTNIIASSIYFGGKPLILVDLLVNDKVEACVSESIMFEYHDIVGRMQKKYQRLADARNIDEILSHCKVVSPKKHFQICRDSNDNKFIDCAVEGKCIYIVSGDKDLLTLENVLDVQIVTVAEFFEQNADLFEK